MESQLLLRCKATSGEAFGEDNFKLVPFISWDDWNFVRESLFSSCPDSIDSALERISGWRSLRCLVLPSVIEVTASIIEVQQKDSYFRYDLSGSDLLEDDMLTMLYCMTIMRLVNGVVEKTRKRYEVSIAKAADVIGIPRMLIDIRHDCSHRDLPSLKVARDASTKALEFLKSYYWEPQSLAIPRPSDRAAYIRKEIKSKIRELAFSLNVKQTTGVVKEKCIKNYEHLRGRYKVLSLMAIKLQSSKSAGSKKHIKKALKNLIKLYNLFSSEVVSILVKFLLKGLESAAFVEPPNSSQVGKTGAYHTRFDDWKPLIIKLVNKEPEMLLTLLKAVLQMIEAQEALKYDLGGEQIEPKFHQTEQLCCLFEWLVANLNDLKLSLPKKSLPKSTLLDFLRKCLAVSSLGNKHLTTAALLLSQMTSNNTLVEKVNQLMTIHTPNLDAVEEIPPEDSEIFHTQQENSLNDAAKKLEFFKQKLSNNTKTKCGVAVKFSNQLIAKSWNFCRIGALPSGVLPVLDMVDGDQKHDALVEGNANWELTKCRKKREAECCVAVLDNSDFKKLKESYEDVQCRKKREADYCVAVLDNSDFKKLKESYEEDANCRLMIGGAWKTITDNELSNIASAIKILV